ncbi:MAG TPA: hypothetical protein DHU33_03985 [Firmicutes bacterium]|nr:hypothetical protein [Bacillota bacterium]
MLEHLNNVINDISLIKKSSKYNLDHVDVDFLEKSIIKLKNELEANIDLEKVNVISKTIYQLNVDNTFSELTDHISNEFYAFEFMLEQKIKEEKL